MKEIIDHILDGKFDYDSGLLDFSCSKIDLTVPVGENYEGSFTIQGPPNKLIEGFVFSSDMRMKCLSNHFTGNGEEIGFVFQNDGLENGENLRGKFSVISNQGEYTIPFEIRIIDPAIEVERGDIKNLFYFSNLAKTDWKEAVRLFYEPGFSKILQENDAQYMTLYRGLSKHDRKEQNVEEFLIAVHKKQKIEYLVEEEKICINLTPSSAQREIQILRNGWGYTSLNIKIQGDFMTTEKEQFSEEDFKGNRCSFYIYFDRTKLHSGTNYGTIYLYNSYTEIELPIEIKADVMIERDFRLPKQKQQDIYDLTKAFISFRAKSITHKAWLTQTVEIIQRMLEQRKEDPIPWLFQAQLLVTENKINEAGWTLEHARAMLMQSNNNNPELWSYYLYLTTLLQHDEDSISHIAMEVEDTYKLHQDNWRLAWLLLFLLRELNTSVAKRWLFLQEQYQHGCNSPLIYVEAWQMLKAEPSLLNELGEFEVSILIFAARKKLLTREIIHQLHYVVSRSKYKIQLVFFILNVAYQMYHDSVTLMTICSMLIQNQRMDHEVFKWYAAAVEQDLRVTRLYEYYMYSLNLETEINIPREVFMYFAFNSNLDYEHTAYLYANLIKRQEEFPDLLEEVQFQIQNFVMNMLRKKKINFHLAYLYEHVIEPHMLDGEIQKALADIFFSKTIKLEKETYQKVIVLHSKLATESSYAIHNNDVTFPCYEDNVVILLEDQDENRMVLPASTPVYQLMHGDEILQFLAEANVKHIGLQIYLCNHDHDAVSITQENLNGYRMLVESPDISPDFRQEIIVKLLHYMQVHQEIEQIDAMLEILQPDIFPAKSRAEVINFLIDRGKVEKATEWIKKYGMFDVEPEALARLASMFLSGEKEVEEELLLRLCYQAFEKNQYDKNTLQYLMDYYEGTTKQLRDIWKKAIDNQMDVHTISERLLIEMLFTRNFVGEKIAIFCSYINGKTSISLEKAFLARCSYDYFVKDSLTDAVVFDEIGRLALRGEELQKVSRLAYARYYAENSGKITEEEKRVLVKFLTGLLEENIGMPWFGVYASIFRFMEEFHDKTIIEYKTNPDANLVIHYVILQKGGQIEEEYHSKKMMNVYGGVWEAQFILFFGETLKYYISEEKEGQHTVLENNSITRSDMGGEIVHSRFNALNDIMISKTLQNYETMNKLLQDYVKNDYMQDKLFQIQIEEWN